MEALRVSLFGAPVVRNSGHDITHQLGSRALHLLAYLVLRRDRPHSRERLAEELWSEQSGVNTRKRLRQALWTLRRVIACEPPTDDDLLLVDGTTIQLNSNSALWIDIATFEAAADAARGSSGASLSNAMAETLHRALALYTGDLLEGSYEDWCIIERERFQVMLISVLDKLTDWSLAQHDPESASHYGYRLLAQDPTRERAHRQVMLACSLGGDRAGAVRQYERCTEILREELDVGPSSYTTDLLNRILLENADLLSADPVEHWPQHTDPVPNEDQLGTAVQHLTCLHTRVKQIESELLQQIKILRAQLR